MNVVAVKAPKVHLRQSTVAISDKPDKTPTELVLIEFARTGASVFKKAQYKRHCENPSKMGKDTLWALYQLGLKLRAEGITYRALQLTEIRRLISEAPANIRAAVQRPLEI